MEKAKMVFNRFRNNWVSSALGLTLVITGAVWVRALLVGFSTDDYSFLLHLAPVNSLSDILRPFWTSDWSLIYWRPLAVTSTALDFFLWGWNGQGFHVTNLLLHLLATAIVAIFVRRIFRMSPQLCVVVALLFGIAASHESDVLWLAERDDILVAIFTMLAMLTHLQAMKQRNAFGWILLGCFCFLCALSSKESGLFALPLIVVLLEAPVYFRKRSSWNSIALRLIPYFIILGAFLFIRSQFALPISGAEPLISARALSPIAFLRNVIYGVGYTILPLDLDQATQLITRAPIWIWIIVAFTVSITVVYFVRLPRDRQRIYWEPLAFALITGSVTMVSFQRWRMYMPSIGVLAIVALLVHDLWCDYRKQFSRIILVTGCAALIVFHLERAWSAEGNWRMAAEAVQNLKHNLILFLAAHPKRPIRLNLIDVPAKLGSASVMLVSVEDFLRQCEAERLQIIDGHYHSVDESMVSVERAVNLYAFNIEQGFAPVRWHPGTNGSVVVGRSLGSKLLLQPALLMQNGESPRDWKFQEGDTISVGTNLITILGAQGSFADSVLVTYEDSSWVPVIFDGEKFTIIQ